MRTVAQYIENLLPKRTHSNLIEARDSTSITLMSQRFYTDRDALKQIIEKVPERTLMIEVGSLAGFSTRLFSLFFEKVISVDPYIPGYDSSDINSELSRLALARDLFILRFFDDPRVEQINKRSSEASTEFGDHSIDFVYIDAAHDYASVRADIWIWMPKVKHGSYIAGDDYNLAGVSQAVRELLPVHEVVGGRWIARVAAKQDALSS